jgi:hypothetical protein
MARCPKGMRHPNTPHGIRKKKEPKCVSGFTPPTIPFRSLPDKTQSRLPHYYPVYKIPPTPRPKKLPPSSGKQSVLSQFWKPRI